MGPGPNMNMGQPGMYGPGPGGPNDMMGPNGPMSSPIHNNMNSPMGGPNGNASMGPGMGSPNQMGIAGPKSSPMGNDPSIGNIPTPPGSMGPSTTPTSMPPSSTGGNFKNSPIMGDGPSMNDPAYAQQFHDFQQQLYATNTRSSQMRGGGPPGPPGPGGGMPPMGQGNFYGAGPGPAGPMSSSAK